MNKRNLIIGIVVLTVLVGGVVLWNGKNNQQEIKQQTKKEVTKQTQEQKTAQKQETTKEQINTQNQAIDGELKPEEKIDTSNWKTYRNEELGFEVKYPKIAKLYNDYVYISDGKTISFVIDNVHKQNNLEPILFSVEYSQIINNEFEQYGKFSDFIDKTIDIKNLNRIKKTKNGLTFYKVEFVGNYNTKAFLFQCNNKVLAILLNPHQNAKFFTEEEFYKSVLQNIKCINNNSK